MTPIPDPSRSVAPQSLRLVPIQRLAMAGRWRVEAMRSLREPTLFWFTQGQGRITVAGNTRGYGAHNAVFVPPGVMHGFEMTSRVHGTAVYLGQDHGLTLPDHPLHLRVRDVASQTEFAAILDAIQRELDGGRPGCDRAARHHLGLLGVWLDRQTDRAAEAERPAEDEGHVRGDAARRLAARYARMLERQFDAGIRITDFAAALGVTPTHLTRACKAACGRSAHDLLQDRVLFEARRLLVDTTIPVKDIANRLGFGSAAYFTRAFQQGTGVTPTGFRRGEAAGPPAGAAKGHAGGHAQGAAHAHGAAHAAALGKPGVRPAAASARQPAAAARPLAPRSGAPRFTPRG